MAKRVSKPIVGLDIEPSAITAAQVSVNGSISIDRAATVPLEHGIVRDGEVADVDALARRCGRSTARTRVSTSASGSASRTRRSWCARSSCRR
jgi:Tfp pilus assembly PilM family ATPase